MRLIVSSMLSLRCVDNTPGYYTLPEDMLCRNIVDADSPLSTAIWVGCTCKEEAKTSCARPGTEEGVLTRVEGFAQAQQKPEESSRGAWGLGRWVSADCKAGRIRHRKGIR